MRGKLRSGRRQVEALVGACLISEDGRSCFGGVWFLGLRCSSGVEHVVGFDGVLQWCLIFLSCSIW